MSLMRMNPLQDVQNIQDVMNRMFESTLSSFWGPRVRWDGRAFPVDIYQTDNDVVLIAELPGFEKDEIDISLEGGQLTIVAERKFEEHKDRTYHQVERWYGRMERTFQLPASVKSDGVRAHLKNGVLTVTIPKKEEARTRQIPVVVG